MSEIDTRPPATRGRSSHRGGRTGFSRGGARGSRKLVNGSNADSTAQAYDPIEDQGELGEMKKKYASELQALRDMFPEWTDVDLVFAVHEADGDIPSTVDHITQGNVSQFAEVKSSKDRARSKVKEGFGAAGGTDKGSIKAGRGRGGLESTRGGRGRGADRPRGSIRGTRGGLSVSGGVVKDSNVVSVPTTESSAWAEGVASAAPPAAQATAPHDTAAETSTGGASPWSHVVAAESTPATASEGAKSSLIPEGGPKKSWASMFAPKPQPVPVAKLPARQPPPAAEPPAVPRITAEVPPESGETILAEVSPAVLEVDGSLLNETPASTAASLPPSSEGEEVTLPPSKVPLTEENVEHLPDESVPPATLTVASTAGSADPRNLTPLPTQTSLGKTTIGGYATSAYRAAGVPIRSASFQRRVQEQQEAVVMPGHNAVDRAAVQFGSMGLNGEPGMDVDEDREEPETRQAPQHSPPSQPRTSLPPAPRHIITAPEVAEQSQVTKPAPGLPPAMQQNQQQVQEAILNPELSGDAGQINQVYNQYARYGQHGIQSETGVPQQKSYDPFSHQAQSSQYDQYGLHSQQIAQQQQQQSQSHGGYGGPGSTANDATSHYNEQQRNAYHHYYGNSFAPQDMRSQVSQSQQHELGVNQQRSGSGFGAGPVDSAFASQGQQQTQSRYGDNTGSGHNTPNPVSNTQQQSMQQTSGHQQGYSAGHAGFPYGHPYYNSPYQQAYNNQFGFSHQLGGYGGSYPGNKNMYAGSHGYGMGPQSSFDQHSSSPANTGAFAQTQQSAMRSASGMSGLSGGLDDYNRSSNQSHQQSSGFGASNDPFARSTSGLGGQGGYGQQASATQDESLKALADNKSGPSPSLQPGRPGSASNSSVNVGQSGLPPPQGQQSGFGAYPGFPGQSQYGGLGSLGTPQHGQNNMGAQGYGSYGAGGFSQTYGSYTSRGGWGSNYGAH